MCSVLRGRNPCNAQKGARAKLAKALPCPRKRVTLAAMRPAFQLIFALLLGAGCSRTAPESQWPPPGPKDGLPVAPFPDKEDSEPEPTAEAAPEPPKPEGIDGALPKAPPTALSRSHQCKDAQCRLAKLVPDVAFAKAQPGGADSPGTFWLEDVAPSSTLTFPRHQRVEVLALVLGGKLLASGDEGGAALTLDTWGALRAPGAGLNLKAGPEGAKVVLALATKSGTLADAVTELDKKAFAVRWLKRPAPLAQVSLDSVKDLGWGGGAFHARIGFGGEGTYPGSLGALLTSASATIKEHDHPTWEHIAILDGEGTMKMAGKDYPVTPGAVFDIPPGEKHAFTPSGKRALLAVQMYTPSGPEQRFIQLASAAEKAGPGPAPGDTAPKK